MGETGAALFREQAFVQPPDMVERLHAVIEGPSLGGVLELH